LRTRDSNHRSTEDVKLRNRSAIAFCVLAYAAFGCAQPPRQAEKPAPCPQPETQHVPTEEELRARAAKLAGKLGAEEYMEREAAQAELEKMLRSGRGGVVLQYLRTALKAAEDAEVSTRLGRILRVYDDFKVSPAVLDAVPGIAVLFQKIPVECANALAGALGKLDFSRSADATVLVLKSVIKALLASGEMRRLTVGVVAGMGKPVVEALAALLDDDSEEVRHVAVMSLAKMGDARAGPFLLKALRECSDIVTLDNLLNLGKPAVEALIAGLSDENASLRWRCVLALGQAGDRQAVEPLVRTLKDEDTRIREAAAQALGKIGDKKATEALIEALSDSDCYVREFAAKALGEIGEASAVEPLVGILKDEIWQVRCAAASALGCIGDRRAIPALTEALKDKETSVKSFAAQAIFSITGDYPAADREEEKAPPGKDK
jgi:hypothetical protein